MRLALKTTSYGITHIAVATGVAYAITGNLAMALGIGLIEPIVQTGIFAFHEYLWERDKPATSGAPRIYGHSLAQIQPDGGARV